LEIAADEAEFAEAVEQAAKKVSRQVNIHGFRPGKAPRHMIERLYGREIFLEEAHKSIMDRLYRQALQQEELVPVGEPEVEMTAADPVAFNVVVSVYPTIDAGDYAAVRVEPIDAAVNEEQVDEVIERMRKSASPWVDVEPARKPQEGDQVTVDMAIILENGEPFQEPLTDSVFVIGESQLFEPLKNAIMDLNIGETTEVTIAFDEDDQSAAEALRGQAVTYTVTLKAVKEKQLLDLDDEFAKTVAGEESFEALRQAVRDDLHQGATNDARNEVLNSIVEKIAEGGQLEVPAPMIDDAVTEEIERLRTRLSYQRLTLEGYLRAQNQTEEELREELRPAVAERLRHSLFLRKVAEQEEIAVDDAELAAEVEQLIAASPNPENARQVYEQDRYLRSVLRNDLFDRKLTDRLIEIATEGRGAVTNPWVKPEPVEGETEGAAAEAEASRADTGEAQTATAETAAPAAETTEAAQPETGAAEGGETEATAAGECPADRPIKGNADSMIYHAPGSRAYARTIPEVCFATAEEAEAAGYRAAKGDTDHVGQIEGDGSRDCPEKFPIKGNSSSMIYHLPGGRSYDQTIPEVCFASEDDAVAAGYRASKAGAAHAETNEDDDEE
jgi:trigger factor